VSSPAQRLESDRLKYPAMNVAEILVWREWLRIHQGEYGPLPDFWLAYRKGQIGAEPKPGDKFDYNVRIGNGRDPGPGFADNIRQMAIAITQFRLDAVGFKGDTPVIFEVKRDLGPAQVGQILAYDAIWRAQKLTPVNPIMQMVGADFKENALPLVQESGIKFDLVPVDFRVLSPYNTTPLTS
jgi:hypothetical protein